MKGGTQNLPTAANILLNVFFLPGTCTPLFTSKVRIMNTGGISRNPLICSKGHRGTWPGRRKETTKSPMKMKARPLQQGTPLLVLNQQEQD